MHEIAKEISQRVRGLREDRAVTQEEMAGRLQVTPQTYAAYESAALDFPASILSEIATQLTVDLGLLLTGDAPKMTLFSVTRRVQGAVVEQRNSYMYENLTAYFKGAEFESFVVTVTENQADAPIPQNCHPGQEFNYMLEGSMLLKIGDQEIELSDGDSVIFDSTKPHGMKGIDGPAKFLAIITT